MKKVPLFLAVAAAAVCLFAPNATAQRAFVERPGATIGVRHAGDWHAANSLRHLNRELRQAQYEVRAFRGEGRRIRYRLAYLARATDRLNYDYHRRRVRSLLVHRQAEQVRAEVRRIRSALRGGRRWR